MNYFDLNDLAQNLIVIGLFAVETILYFVYKRKLMGGHLLESLKNNK